MKIIKETLGNGLTVILVPVAGTKTVTGVFAVRAGWKYETSENHGIAMGATRKNYSFKRKG